MFANLVAEVESDTMRKCTKIQLFWSNFFNIFSTAWKQEQQVLGSLHVCSSRDAAIDGKSYGKRDGQFGNMAYRYRR